MMAYYMPCDAIIVQLSCWNHVESLLVKLSLNNPSTMQQDDEQYCEPTLNNFSILKKEFNVSSTWIVFGWLYVVVEMLESKVG